MTLKAYPKYKDSGVDWIGKVPSDWNVLPNRSLFYEVKNPNHITEQLLSVTISRGVISQEDLINETSKKDSSNIDKSKYKLVTPGDIVYNKMRAWQGALGVSRYQGIVSPAYIVQRPRSEIVDSYFHFLFRTPLFSKEAERWSYGITSDQWSLRAEHFKLIYSPVPSRNEQVLIARYLTHINNKIQKYISAKKKLIKLLDEQKQAIIHQAVTGAIDVNTGKPYPKYKDLHQQSSLNVPYEWEESKIKFVCSIHNGSDHKEIESSSGYPVFGSGGQFSYASRFIYDKESVLFGRKGTIDKPLYVNQPFWTVDTMFYTKIFNTILPKFLFYIAKTIPYQFYSTQTALPSMTQTILGNYRIGLPSLDVQRNVISYIETENYAIDETIELARKEIELLQEYRTRLTADVVTGKVDVREAANDLPKDIEDVIEDLEEKATGGKEDISDFEENYDQE